MSTTLRWVLRAMTVLTVVGLLYFTYLGVMAEDARIYLVTGLLAAVFSFFVFVDV